MDSVHPMESGESGQSDSSSEEESEDDIRIVLASIRNVQTAEEESEDEYEQPPPLPGEVERPVGCAPRRFFDSTRSTANRGVDLKR